MQSDREDDSLDERRLYEVAGALQVRWTKQYVQDHQLRRKLSWALAVPLAVYLAFGLYRMVGGGWWNAFLIPVFFTAVPLGCIHTAAELARQNYPSVGHWTIASSLFLVSAVGFAVTYHEPWNLQYGILHTIVALAIPSTLGYGLHITLNPAVDWDLVMLDFISRAQSAERSAAHDYQISDYNQAEEVAAAWLRRFGYADAKVSGKTESGHDDGVNIFAARAVAQVKYWVTKRVGIKHVQQLAGAAQPWQDKLFFAASATHATQCNGRGALIKKLRYLEFAPTATLFGELLCKEIPLVCSISRSLAVLQRIAVVVV